MSLKDQISGIFSQNSPPASSAQPQADDPLDPVLAATLPEPIQQHLSASGQTTPRRNSNTEGQDAPAPGYTTMSVDAVGSYARGTVSTDAQESAKLPHESAVNVSTTSSIQSGGHRAAAQSNAAARAARERGTVGLSTNGVSYAQVGNRSQP